METFLGIILVIVSGLFAYMSCHVNEEIRRGKTIPLPWEKK
tara:strand:+ start:3412 stop:3534 length:123 start_codon:yes stop_codon:yes gene_type:complete